jgi:hypothetical protein
MWIVTTQDVLNRWVNGEAPYADEPVFLTLLEDAQGLIRDEFSDLDERILTETFLLSKIKIVTAKVIQRAMKADFSGFISQSNTDGAFGASQSKSTSTKQGLFLDSDDIEMLSPKGSRGGVQVIGFNDGPVTNYYGW